ncbi:MAG: CHRD domain-containing protein [Ferruginibacter sp.]
MKRFLMPVLILSVIYLAVSCTKGGVPEKINGAIDSVYATATSKQLIPSIDTTSTGTLTGTYDEVANIFSYTVAWTDLWRDTKKDTITAINFYGPATATGNGTLVRSLPFSNTNRTGQVVLGLAGISGFLPSEVAVFLKGGYYFTLNTRRYPNGIIRGQLNVIKQ